MLRLKKLPHRGLFNRLPLSAMDAIPRVSPGDAARSSSAVGACRWWPRSIATAVAVRCGRLSKLRKAAAAAAADVVALRKSGAQLELSPLRVQHDEANARSFTIGKTCLSRTRGGFLVHSCVSDRLEADHRSGSSKLFEGRFWRSSAAFFVFRNSSISS